MEKPATQFSQIEIGARFVHKDEWNPECLAERTGEWVKASEWGAHKVGQEEIGHFQPSRRVLLLLQW